MYGAGAWKLRVENKHRLRVTFNRAIRCLFGYNDYESIKDILFGFKMLPINLLSDKAQLLLCSMCLQSERILLKMCAMHKRDSDVFMNVLMLYGAKYSVHIEILLYHLSGVCFNQLLIGHNQFILN